MSAADFSIVPKLAGEPQRRAFLYGGLLLMLMNFASPAGGLIDIPVTFFLKNRMHLEANQLALFKLWVGIPLLIGFIFGFIRDRWSPFNGGDRAHLIVFGVLTALIYGAMAAIIPTYTVFLVGLFIATMAFRMVSSAVYGAANKLANKYAVSGQISGLIGVGMAVPDLISVIGGGMLSQTLEGTGAAAAAHVLYMCAAGMMLAIAAMGVLGPKWVLKETQQESADTDLIQDLKRLVRHWPIYPAMLIQLLWSFAPAAGTVLQYHIVDHLHATDFQWGLWLGLLSGSFVPMFVAYARLSKRFTLRSLLWFGFTIGVFQMFPLLVVDTVLGALLAAVPIGIIGGIAQGALLDLTIRSSPRGSHGVTMMLFFSCTSFSVRIGDLFGTWVYDQHGGFMPTVVITIIIYVLILPVLLLIPRWLISTKDGEVIEE